MTLSDLGINVPAPNPEAPPVPDATAGWIVGSIGEIPQKMISLSPGGSPYGRIRIQFRNDTGTISSAIEFSIELLTPTPIDFQADKEKSAVFAMKLPEGNYVIDGLLFSAGGAPQVRNCSVKDKIAIPFTVEHGAAIYLGSLIASADWGPNRVGLMAPICGYFTVHERSARDEPVIRAKFADVTGPLEIHLLTANSDEERKFFRAE